MGMFNVPNYGTKIIGLVWKAINFVFWATGFIVWMYAIFWR